MPRLSCDHLSVEGILRVDTQRKSGEIKCGEWGAGALCNGVMAVEINMRDDGVVRREEGCRWRRRIGTLFWLAELAM